VTSHPRVLVLLLICYNHVRESSSERVQSIKGARRYVCRKFWLFFNFEVVQWQLLACPHVHRSKARTDCFCLASERKEFFSLMSLDRVLLSIQLSWIYARTDNKRVNNLSTLLTYMKRRIRFLAPPATIQPSTHCGISGTHHVSYWKWSSPQPRRVTSDSVVT